MTEYDIYVNIPNNEKSISVHLLKEDLDINESKDINIMIHNFNTIDAVPEQSLRNDKYINTFSSTLLFNNNNYIYIKQKAPDSQYEWLSTTHITEVLTQYEKIYPDFYFLGAVPIDFMEIYNIYNVGDMSDSGYIGYPPTYINQLLDRGFKKFGIVINLSDSKSIGTHWVSCYADITKGMVCFFDSAAGTSHNRIGINSHVPDSRIINLLNIFKKCFEDRGIPTIIKINQVRHQYSDSECGMYAITFIIRMLNGESYENIINYPINDSDINKYRRLYFD
jgi:hypothetical protein